MTDSMIKVGDTVFLSNPDSCIYPERWFIRKIIKIENEQFFADVYGYVYAVKYKDFTPNDIPGMFKSGNVFIVNNGEVKSYINEDISPVTPGMLGFFSNELSEDIRGWNFGRIKSITQYSGFSNDFSLCKYDYFIPVEDFNPDKINLLKAYQIRLSDFNNLVVERVERLEGEAIIDCEYGWLSNFMSYNVQDWKLSKYKIDREDGNFISERGLRYSYLIPANCFNPYAIGRNIQNDAYYISGNRVKKYNSNVVEKKNWTLCVFSNNKNSLMCDWTLSYLDEETEDGFVDSSGRKFKYMVPIESFQYNGENEWVEANKKSKNRWLS